MTLIRRHLLEVVAAVALVAGLMARVTRVPPREAYDRELARVMVERLEGFIAKHGPLDQVHGPPSEEAYRRDLQVLFRDWGDFAQEWDRRGLPYNAVRSNIDWAVQQLKHRENTQRGYAPEFIRDPRTALDGG